MHSILRSLIKTKDLYRVLVHSRQKCAEPIAKLAEANFTEGVHNVLVNKMCIRSAYRTQAVSWPHILRMNSVVLINNAATGKLINT